MTARRTLTNLLDRARRTGDLQVLRTKTPLAGGVSWDRHTVFLDPRLPDRLPVGDRTVDVGAAVASHELGEGAELAAGRPYREAHQHGGRLAETQYLAEHGVGERAFNRALAPYLRAIERQERADGRDRGPAGLDPQQAREQAREGV